MLPLLILQLMTEPVYRFGKFDLCSGELRDNGTRIRMQEKPLLLLTALLENPKQIVTREQLRQRMWPSGTFVDYEQGINVAIKKVRDSLGDSADQPEYIETIAKKGYRFLLRVEVVERESDDSRSLVPQAVLPALGNTPTEIGRTGAIRSTWIISAIVIAIAVALVLALVHLRASRQSAKRIKSIAVLPLQNLSADPQQEYFADGITEELTTNLAQLRTLTVISRTSAMRYKQTREPLAQLARDLGVDAVVEGSVMRSGNRIRITAQLIDAATDHHLWASSYQRDLGDVLLLQMEIARDISRQVGATLAPELKSASAQTRTVDPQVYDLCLLGRYHLNKRTEPDLKQAIGYFQTAIDRDPSYAPAFADLASAYAILSYYTNTSVAEDIRKAEATAEHALQLDESLAEAHATLGLLTMEPPTVRWVKGDREFRRAIELNPSDATAHHWYAFYLELAERQSEALVEIELARQLDPLSLIIYADEGTFLQAARRFDEAVARLHRAIELEPNFGQAHQMLALVYAQTGKMSDAIAETRLALKLDPDNPATMAQAGYVLAVSGNRAEAERLLVKLRHADPAGTPLNLLALVYLGLGQDDRALDLLEQMYDPRTGAGPYGIVQWTPFESLANNPRYQRLRQRMREMRIATSQ